MNLSSSQSFLSVFQLSQNLFAALAVCLGALFYLRRVRLERPAIGRFNGRDVMILFAFLVLLPGFYLLLPQWALAVANLYVQGGMQVRHVAWFAGALAVYDSMFTLVWPVSNSLIREFVNHPLFPAMGMRIGFDESIVGLGDLLVFAGFTLAAYKAYGRPGLRLALPLVVVFGIVLPTLSGLLINYVDARLDVVIPVQTWFGPAAVIGYLWLRRRYGRERTMKEYLASVDAGRRELPATAVIPEEPKIESKPPVSA